MKQRRPHTRRLTAKYKPYFKVGMPLMGIAAQRKKLTEEDVRYIRKAAALARWLRKNDPKRAGQRIFPRGFRLRLAEKFGVTVHCIKKVLYRQRWPHIKVDLHARHRDIQLP